MRPTGAATVLVAVALVVAAVPAGSLAQSADSTDIAPGERLAGVVGVQGAEVDAAVEERTFAERIRRADTNASKSAVVADRLNRTRERLDELEARQETLREARENGTISEGGYRARMARLAAEVRTVERALNTTAETSRGLPDETLRANGVNVTAIEQLRTRASNMTGPEVAEIARGIAGSNAGGPPSGVSTRAGERGPPDNRGNGSAAREGSGPSDRTGGAANGSDDRTGGDNASARGTNGGAADGSSPPSDRGGSSQADSERATDRRSGGSNRSSDAGPPTDN